MTFNQQNAFNFSNTQKPPIFTAQKPNGIFGSNTQNQAPLGFSFASSFNKPTSFSSNQTQQQPQGHFQAQTNTQTQFSFGKTTGNVMNGINGTSPFASFGGSTQQKQGNNAFGQQKNDLQMPTLTRNNAPNGSSNGSAFGNGGQFGFQNANNFNFSKPGLSTNTVSNFPTNFNSMVGKKKFEPIKSKNVKLDCKHVVKCIAYADEYNGQCMKELRAKFIMSASNQQQNGNIPATNNSFGFGNFNGGKTSIGGNFGGNGLGGNSSFSFGNNGGNGFSFGGNKNAGVSIGGNGFGGPAVGGNNTMFGAFGNGKSTNSMSPQTQSVFNFNVNNTNNHTLPQSNTNFAPNHAFTPQNQFNSQKPGINTFGNVGGTVFGSNNGGIHTNSFGGNGINQTSGNGFSFGNHSNGNVMPQTLGNMGFGQGNNCSQMNQNMQIQNQGVVNGMFGSAIPQFGPQCTSNILNVSSNGFSNQGANFGRDSEYQSVLINSFLGSDLFKSLLANHKIEPFEELTNRITLKEEEEAKQILNHYNLSKEEYGKTKSYSQGRRSNQTDGDRENRYANIEFYKDPYIFTDPNSYEINWGQLNKLDTHISKYPRVKNEETKIVKNTPLNNYQECFNKFHKRTLKEIAVKPEELPINDSNFILSPSLEKLSQMTSFELSRISNMKFENKFGRILIKSPINILNKKLSESLNIGQDEFEIIDPQWHNSRCEVLLKNFSRYTELNECEKNRISRRMRKWADRNQLTILEFDITTGDVTLEFCC